MKKITLAISLFLSSPLAQAAAADLPQQIQGENHIQMMSCRMPNQAMLD